MAISRYIKFILGFFSTSNKKQSLFGLKTPSLSATGLTKPAFLSLNLKMPFCFSSSLCYKLYLWLCLGTVHSFEIGQPLTAIASYRGKWLLAVTFKKSRLFKMTIRSTWDIES